MAWIPKMKQDNFHPLLINNINALNASFSSIKNDEMNRNHRKSKWSASVTHQQKNYPRLKTQSNIEGAWCFTKTKPKTKTCIPYH